MDDGIQDDDADEFLVEEKPKDNLDLDTENTSVDVNVSHIEENQQIKSTLHKLKSSRPVEIPNQRLNEHQIFPSSQQFLTTFIASCGVDWILGTGFQGTGCLLGQSGVEHPD